MPSNYIFLESNSLDHYKAVFALHCFDDRFVPATRLFLASLGAPHYDIVSVAGGAKALFDPEKESDRDFLAHQLRLSISLHHTEEVILFTHADCGACGGRARFHGSRGEEMAYHHQGHRRAREYVRKLFPEIKRVRTFFADEDGVIETTTIDK